MHTSIPARSWWLREALTDGAPAAPPLTVELDADVCIVGAGYTGLWTALRIRELAPSLRVVLLEADLAGAGASGRNGGFAMTFWHHFLALERACGSAEAIWLGRESAAAVASIGDFCREHGIDAQFRPDGWLWTATSPAQIGAWAGTVEALARHGERPFAELPAAEVAARAGSDRHLAGVFEAGAASVQPALLARGLRGVALAQGVELFEGSPMVGLDRGPQLVVRTPGGRVRAGRVVIAMNAWAGRLRELRGRFVTIASDLVITEPAPDRLAQAGLRGGVSISDSRLMVHYYRPTPDGRLAFGKGGGTLAYGSRIGRSFEGASPRAAAVAAQMHALEPALADVPLAASWVGPIDRSLDGLPFFTALGRPDLICGLGYSGNGVGPSVLGGRILASMALGREDEWSRCGLVREPPSGLPPEPLSYLGGQVVRGAVARLERAEDAGREPCWIDRRLTALAPPGLVPVD